jgi:hypothetical protein
VLSNGRQADHEHSDRRLRARPLSSNRFWLRFLRFAGSRLETFIASCMAAGRKDRMRGRPSACEPR